MEWRTHQILGAGNTTTWSAGQLGSPGYTPVATWLEGETFVRVRIQGQLTFDIATSDPTMVKVEPSIFGALGCTFGVWARPDGGSATPAQSVPVLTSLDDSWVFYNQMTLTSLYSFHEQFGTDDTVGTYTFPNSTDDSRSKRGPATADTNVYLAFGFESATFNPTINTATSIASLYNYYITVSCLFDHVA
jgi:hypothetical protein